MRRFLRLAAIALALVALLGLVMLMFPATAARLVLAVTGHHDIRFAALRLGFGGLELDGLALGAGGEQRIARLRAGFGGGDLLQGELGTVAIDGLRLQAELDQNGLRLPGLTRDDATPGGPGAGGLWLPPARQVVLQDAELALTTPLGPLTMPFQGELVAGAQDYTLTLSGLATSAAIAQAQIEAGLALRASLPRRQPVLLGEANGEGTLELHLSGLTASPAGYALREIALDQRLELRLQGGALVVAMAQPGRISAAGIAGPDGLTTTALAGRLRERGGPLLRIRLDQNGPAAWQQAGQLVLEPFALRRGGLEIAAQGVVLESAVDGRGSARTRTRLRLRGGNLELPAQVLRLEGVTGEAALDEDGLAAGAAMPLAIARIIDRQQPARLAPLTFDATLTPEPARIAFSGVVQRAAGGVSLSFDGRHELAAGQGEARLRLAPVTFAPGRLQPQGIVPLLGDQLRAVAGRVAADGVLSWQDGALRPGGGSVLVQNLSLTTGPAQLEQINGVIRFDQFWPPRTPQGQELAIGLLDIGLPLTDGTLAFALQPDLSAAIERLEWQFAGGRVRSEPFTVGSAAPDLTMVLHAEGLDLQQLFDLTRLDGLSGSGSINGRLPVQIEAAVARITGGELHAAGDGRLSYRAGGAEAALAAGGENVNLLLQALENFHYEALRITLDGRTDAAMDIGLHLNGANPDLHDGYPVEFNLNVEGDLADLLRAGLAGYRIPERIRERMQGYGR